VYGSISFSSTMKLFLLVWRWMLICLFDFFFWEKNSKPGLIILFF
jgi:hypothetical protein